MKVSIDQQISEVQREIALRRNVYPKMIAAGKLRDGEARECQRRLAAVLDTLIWVRDHQAMIRKAVKT